MQRPHVSRALRVALLACAALGAGSAASAQATTIEYSADDTTLIVSDAGRGENHNIQFRLEGNNDAVIDYRDITSIPADCTYPDGDLKKASCPGHNKVKLILGDEGDEVTFGQSDENLFDCFLEYDLDLGGGSNLLYLSDQCGAAPTPVKITGGSDSDTVYGEGQGPITATGGDGIDTLHGGPFDDVLHGGEGTDNLYGGAGNDQLLGEGGNDAPNGEAGNDLVSGGPGDDSLMRRAWNLQGAYNDPDTGADTYAGGPGIDEILLDKHAPGIAISIDGLGNDGSPGENDNFGSDIELLNGTSGNDTFTGGAGIDLFSGGDGDDVIHGGGGNDNLSGDYGQDQVFGDAGNDDLFGNDGHDTVDGGPGTDSLFGNDEDDTLLARDGERDSINCGIGTDLVKADSLDVFSGSVSGPCESVEREADPTSPGTTTPSGPTTTTPPASTTPTGSTTTPGSTALGSAGSFTTKANPSVGKGAGVTVTCPGSCTFTATLLISATTARKYHLGRKALTIGRATGTLLAAGSKTITVRLSAKANAGSRASRGSPRR